MHRLANVKLMERELFCHSIPFGWELDVCNTTIIHKHASMHSTAIKINYICTLSRWTWFYTGCEVADIGSSRIFVHWFLLAIVEKRSQPAAILYSTNISVNICLHCLPHYSKYCDCFIRVIDCSIRACWSKIYCLSVYCLNTLDWFWKPMKIPGAALERAVFQNIICLSRSCPLYKWPWLLLDYTSNYITSIWHFSYCITQHPVKISQLVADD